MLYAISFYIIFVVKSTTTYMVYAIISLLHKKGSIYYSIRGRYYAILPKTQRCQRGC